MLSGLWLKIIVALVKFLNYSVDDLGKALTMAMKAGQIGISDRAERAPLAVEVASEDGRAHYVNSVTERMFPGASEAIWKAWKPPVDPPKLGDPKHKADYFIPLGKSWRNTPKRAVTGESRRVPADDKRTARVIGYASHLVKVAKYQAVITFYLDITDSAVNEDDLHASMEGAEILLRAIYGRASHRSAGFKGYSKQLHDVGGDFVFHRLSRPEDTKVLLVIGDCAGKGTQAAVQNAIVGAALSRYVDDTHPSAWDPADALRCIDAALCNLVGLRAGSASAREELPSATGPDPGLWSMGADASAVLVDHDAGTVRIACAQLPVFILTPNAVPTGPPTVRQHGPDSTIGKNLGPARLLNRYELQELPPLDLYTAELPLQAHELIVGCTDGLTGVLPLRPGGSPARTTADIIAELFAAGADLTAGGVADALWQTYRDLADRAERPDDAAVAVLACRAGPSG